MYEEVGGVYLDLGCLHFRNRFLYHLQLLGRLSGSGRDGAQDDKGAVDFADGVAGKTELLEASRCHVLCLVLGEPLVAHTAALSAEDSIWMAQGRRSRVSLHSPARGYRPYVCDRTWGYLQADGQPRPGLGGASGLTRPESGCGQWAGPPVQHERGARRDWRQ